MDEKTNLKLLANDTSMIKKICEGTKKCIDLFELAEHIDKKIVEVKHELKN